MDELRSEKKEFDPDIPIGIMIEVPSAAINADRLAEHSDFFSVGTNDLVQYTIAVDRISEKIAYLYNPLNLSVLRLLRHIVDASRKHEVPLSICGEMAGEPLYTIPLLGLGFRNFSMGTAFMHQIKRIIRSVKIHECEELVDEMMKRDVTGEIEKVLLDYLGQKFPAMLF